MTTLHNTSSQDGKPGSEPEVETDQYDPREAKSQGWLLFGIGTAILGITLLFTVAPMREFYNALNDPNPEQNGFFRAYLTMPLVSVPIIVCISLPLIIGGIFSYFKQTEKAVKKGMITGLVAGVLIAISLFVSFAHNSSGQNFIEREKIWAEKRYGVTFNSVTERPVYKGRPIQAFVKNDGNVVAKVVYDGDRMYFFETDGNKELPLIIDK